uniref:Usher syndrome type-1G-like protein n=1 Tax=Magallana gigas TaxID=29159 RepID=K1PSL6_MAGGI
MGDKTEKTVEEIEDEKSAIEEEIEQIRVANAFLEDSRMMSHSTPKPYASTAVLGTERETDYLGDTPIHKAAKRGNMECVSLLISQGASLCLLNHSHCTPSQAAAQNGHLECAQYIENASRLQSQEQVKTMQQCVTMQPSHLVQGQMEQQVAEIPFQNGHFVDGPSPVDTEMDMAGDCSMIGMKRGRDDCCDEESFKRMRKGDRTAFTHSALMNPTFVNNNCYFPHLNGTSVEEHERTVCAQQGYDSIVIHSHLSEFTSLKLSRYLVTVFICWLIPNCNECLFSSSEIHSRFRFRLWISDYYLYREDFWGKYSRL